MRPFAATPWMRSLGLIAIALGAFGFVAGAQADDRHRSRDSHKHQRYEQKRHEHHKREHPRHHYRSYESDRHYRPAYRDADHWHKHRPKYVRSGWHYHGGRYWAPASYRGRYCSDRRHYHGVHYHVAVRDYYDYYYPRYRYYGPHPHQGVASLIISVPLF